MNLYKSDLKPGMVVELRCGAKFQVLDDIAVNENMYIVLQDYTDDMKHLSTAIDGNLEADNRLDIIKVYEATFNYQKTLNYWRCMPCIWERRSPTDREKLQTIKSLLEKMATEHDSDFDQLLARCLEILN